MKTIDAWEMQKKDRKRTRGTKAIVKELELSDFVGCLS